MVKLQGLLFTLRFCAQAMRMVFDSSGISNDTLELVLKFVLGLRSPLDSVCCDD